MFLEKDFVILYCLFVLRNKKNKEQKKGMLSIISRGKGWGEGFAPSTLDEKRTSVLHHSFIVEGLVLE